MKIRLPSSILVLLLIISVVGCQRRPTTAPYFAAQRQRMVDEQIVARGITDSRVLAAMGKVPREQFVPDDVRAASYTDRPLAIGYGQTISQPYIVAFMTEQLHLQSTDQVLEIGTGSGYQAAVLGELAAEVYSVEIIEPLGRSAEATLQRLGCKNVHVKIGDGYKGWPEHAPFDAVIVTCAPDHVPPALVDQAKDGGRIIIPVGPSLAQQLYLLQKNGNQVEKRAILPVRFVPMESGDGRR